MMGTSEVRAGPWLPVDAAILTPQHRKMGRIPLTFQPKGIFEMLMHFLKCFPLQGSTLLFARNESSIFLDHFFFRILREYGFSYRMSSHSQK